MTLALQTAALFAQPAAAAAWAPIIPKGARIGATGHATIRVAPPSPTGDVKINRPTYDGPVGFYAQEEGLSMAEAGKRLSEQWALRPALNRLEERLRKAEPDNYVSARVIHQPDWSYTLYFKRDPEATLRKYQVNPRFKAVKAAYIEAELKTLTAPWLKRFAQQRIGTVYGIDPSGGHVSMTLPITTAEFEAIAVREGWGDVPAALRLSFATEHRVPRIDPRVAPLMRGRHLLQMRVAQRRVCPDGPPLPADGGRRTLRDCVVSPFVPGPESLGHRLAVSTWCLVTLLAPAPVARRLITRRFA